MTFTDVPNGQQKIEQHVDKLMNYIRFRQAAGESEKTSIRTKTRLGQGASRVFSLINQKNSPPELLLIIKKQKTETTPSP